MKLLFIKNHVLRFVLASIVVGFIFFTSIVVLTANKNNEEKAYFKEVENTLDNYGESEVTLTLLSRIDTQISEVFKILNTETSD